VSSFPGSPKLIKGAIVGVSVIDPLSSVVIFQYNPDTLTRTIRVSWYHEGTRQTLRRGRRTRPSARRRDRRDRIEQETRRLNSSASTRRCRGSSCCCTRLEDRDRQRDPRRGGGDRGGRWRRLTLLVWRPKRVARANGHDTEEAFDPKRTRSAPRSPRPMVSLPRPRARQRGRSAVHGAPDREGDDGKAGSPASLAAAGATTLRIRG
jgi:hypothetical protein